MQSDHVVNGTKSASWDVTLLPVVVVVVVSNAIIHHSTE